MSNCGNKKARSEIKICEKPVSHQYGAIENCIIDKRISETTNRKSPNQHRDCSHRQHALSQRIGTKPAELIRWIA